MLAKPESDLHPISNFFSYRSLRWEARNICLVRFGCSKDLPWRTTVFTDVFEDYAVSVFTISLRGVTITKKYQS